MTFPVVAQDAFGRTVQITLMGSVRLFGAVRKLFILQAKKPVRLRA